MSNDTENTTSTNIDEKRPRQWTILLSSANRGVVGEYGHKFQHAEPKHEHVNVVDEAIAQELSARIEQLQAGTLAVSAAEKPGVLTASEMQELAALADRIEEANEQPMVIARSAARSIDKLLAAPAPVTAAQAADLIAEARAVFDLMLEGCRDPKFGDYQNGDGETIGPRMDALHAKLRAYPAPAAAQAVPDAWMTEDGERVVSAATKAGQERDGGASASAMKPYSVPLARAAQAVRVPDLTEAEIADATSDIYLSDFGGKGTQAYDVAVARAVIEALTKKLAAAAPTAKEAEQKGGAA